MQATQWGSPRNVASHGLFASFSILVWLFVYFLYDRLLCSFTPTNIILRLPNWNIYKNACFFVWSYLGNDEDYLNIVIKDGGISVLMKVTTGKLDLFIKPNRLRFDDYRWHKVVVHRRIKEVKFSIIISNYAT